MSKSTEQMSCKNRLSIFSSKLFYVIVTGFFTVMLLVAVSMGSSYRSLLSAEDLVSEIVSSNHQKMGFIQSLSYEVQDRVQLLRQMTKEPDLSLRAEMVSQYAVLEKRFTYDGAEFRGQALTPEEAQVLVKLKSVLNDFNLMQFDVLNALNNGDSKTAITVLLRFNEKRQTFNRVLMQYAQLGEQSRASAQTKINDVFGESLSRMAILSVLTFLVGIVVLFFVVRFTVKQQHKLMDMNYKLETYNKVLQLSTKEAERANKAKSEFIANMNHELRTPITTIKGAVGILNSGMIEGVPGEAQHLISMADKGTDKLIDLLNEVLSFSKLEADEIEVIKKEFNIREEIDEFLVPFYKKARNKSIRFNVLFTEGVPMSIKFDQAHLFQILNQLISNAIKFTPEGDVLLKVEFKEDSENIIFHIVDTGIGLDEKDIHYLFESFVQGDGSSTRKFGGTGIGLAICKRLVDVLDGEIQVSSEKEKGSTFSVSFPVNIAA